MVAPAVEYAYFYGCDYARQQQALMRIHSRRRLMFVKIEGRFLKEMVSF